MCICQNEFKIPNERARARARQTDGTQREPIKRLFSAKISIVLIYLLLKVKLRLKSLHAVRVFMRVGTIKG